MKTRLRELAPAARGSQDAGSRNLVFTFQLSTVNIEIFSKKVIFTRDALPKWFDSHNPFIIHISEVPLISVICNFDRFRGVLNDSKRIDFLIACGSTLNSPLPHHCSDKSGRTPICVRVRPAIIGGDLDNILAPLLANECGWASQIHNAE